MLNFKAIKQWLTGSNSTPNKVSTHFEKMLSDPEGLPKIRLRGKKVKGAFGGNRRFYLHGHPLRASVLFARVWSRQRRSYDGYSR